MNLDSFSSNLSVQSATALTMTNNILPRKQKEINPLPNNRYILMGNVRSRHYCADGYPCHVGRYFIWEKIVVAQNG
ncbi:hypothetical protein CFP56_035503 [Quercus suber]|uniref:Uncharacterized protein n=1 Tax=Quercus suber TaxID=58331 RepID=A0AAW0LRK3_QUESU